MGSFVLAGAVEGLGKGMGKAAEMKQESQMLERESTLMEARDNRLAALRHKYRTDELGQVDEYQTTAATVQNKRTVGAEEERVLTDQIAVNAAHRQTMEVEEEKSRSDAEVARIRAEAYASSGTSTEYSEFTNRFELGTPSYGLDGMTEYYSFTDRKNNVTYQIQGDKYIGEGEPHKIPEVLLEGETPKAFKKRRTEYENAERFITNADGTDPLFEQDLMKFLEDYNYLPRSVFPKMQNLMLSKERRGLGRPAASTGGVPSRPDHLLSPMLPTRRQSAPPGVNIVRGPDR